MNILPKKSWHVRNKRNIERVRRDEKKALEEEEEKQRRVELAEKEARLNILRKKARSRYGDDEPTQPVRIDDRKNDDETTVTTNREHELEKKVEQERLEKKLGILTYLGQSAIESQKGKPWYCDVSQSKTTDETAAKKDKKIKDTQDPLNDIKKYLDMKKAHEQKSLTTTQPSSKESVTSKKNKGSGKSIEELRAERIRRERTEKQKQQELLKRVYGIRVEQDSNQISNNVPYRKYNSQFHPEYARQTRKRSYGD